MAGLYAPLPTLRRRPRGRLRTARGRCGSLLLHRSGLAPQTPCRSPGALTRVAARTLAQSPICDRLHRGLQPFRHLHDCSGCFRLERLPGGACTHWNAPPSHGAHVERTQQIAGGRREVLPSNGRPGTGGLRPKRTCVPPAGTSRPLQSVATRTLPPEGRHILVVRFAVVAEIDRRGRTTRFRSTGPVAPTNSGPGSARSVSVRERGRGLGLTGPQRTKAWTGRGSPRTDRRSGTQCPWAASRAALGRREGERWRTRSSREGCRRRATPTAPPTSS